MSSYALESDKKRARIFETSGCIALKTVDDFAAPQKNYCSIICRTLFLAVSVFLKITLSLLTLAMPLLLLFIHALPHAHEQSSAYINLFKNFFSFPLHHEFILR